MLQITFKQKLIAVVILTLVGISYLGFVSFSSLNQLNQSAQRVSNLTSTSDLLSKLQLDLLTTENQLSQLQPQNLQAFGNSLNQISIRHATAIEQAINQAEDSELKAQLKQIADQFDQYTQAIKAMNEAQTVLGFDNQSGLLKPLSDSATKLEEQLSTFSMLLQPFIITRQFEKEYLIDPSPERADKLNKQLEKVIFEVKDAEFYDAFGGYIEDYQAKVNALTDAATALSTSQKALDQTSRQFKNNRFSSQQYLQTELLSTARKEAKEATEKTQWTIITVSIVVALIICFMLVTTAYGAIRTLTNIVSQLNKIAAGNLTEFLVTKSHKPDEFDQVASAVNKMTDDLRQVICQVAESQSKLFTQSSELSHSIHTIAGNNTQVSDQSNHLASATEEISATTEQVAGRVLSLQGDSQNAHQAAIDGGGIISKAMNSLSETAVVVEESSQQLQQLEQHSADIDKVLVIINDLADQTNLLALNAAIEAARAGEAGRGFSVVADEVRTLAESTVKATGDITGTVRAIQQQTRSVIQVMNKSKDSIDAVKDQGGQAQQAVERIERQTEQAFTTSSEITSAIEEVARTTREMATSMDQIALGVEQNSSASSAIVSSADELKQNAERMGQMTQQFSY